MSVLPDEPDVMNAQDHFDAVVAAVAANAAPGDEFDVLEINEVPQDVPDLWATAHVSRRYTGESTRIGSGVGVQGWRLDLKVTGRSPGACRWGLWQATKALEERSLTVAGQHTTPLEFETGNSPREDDDGRYSADVAWTYSL